MTSVLELFLKSKVAQVMDNCRTFEYERCYYLAHRLDTFHYKNNIDKIMDEASYHCSCRNLLKEANKVMRGECPHKRDVIGTYMVTRRPRDWMTYTEECAQYSKCLICGN